MDFKVKTQIALPLTIFISMVVMVIIHMYYNKQTIEVIETRKFDVLNGHESDKIVSEMENKYLLWNTESERELIEQPFEDWSIKLTRNVPKILETGSLIYFPKTFKPSFPMFYKTTNESSVEYFYPKPNSMLIVDSEPVDWEGKTDQVVIIGIKSRDQIRNFEQEPEPNEDDNSNHTDRSD